MMQAASSPFCCCSSSSSYSSLAAPPVIPSVHLPRLRPHLSPPFRAQIPLTLLTSFHLLQFPFKPLLPCRLPAISPLHATATQEILETAESGLGFVEVGYLSSVHGIQGEVCVKPSTDFPELRFSKPGKRWLRQPVLGKEIIQEVELVEGRGHPGQSSWILRFEGIDAVEQARQLVGSTLLVRENDRPDLEEGEFYTRDLIGMRVILKETGECVGNVVNVFNTGGSDLLHVMLYQSGDMAYGMEELNSAETSVSGPLVWVPFVEAIVPDVDMVKRELRITPPKGLLELNLRSDERSKKERRQLEWRERKKFQRRLIAAKKKLCELEQKHVFDGLRYGEKSQRSLLADEIVGVNSKLLQQALQHINIPVRWPASELITTTKLIKDSLKISKACLTASATEETLASNSKLRKKGVHLMSKGKLAMVFIWKDIEKIEGGGHNLDLLELKSGNNALFSILQRSLNHDETFLKIDDRALVPLILICPSGEIESLEGLFSDNGYFGFNANKVWFLEEEKLPLVDSSIEEQSKHKILMKSPWEILQSPVGSGGIFSLLSSHDILESLSQMEIEYIEICSAAKTYTLGNPVLLGLVNSRKAEVGIQVSRDAKDLEENYRMIFSMNFMESLVKHIDKLRFNAIPKQNAHVKLVEKEWTDVIPSSPNSYRLHCSIYSSLNLCPPDKICVMEVTE